MVKDIERPSISSHDFKMRLFVDTNVLIDFVEDRDDKKSKSFIVLFKNSNFNNIELVTSDYVLWEFYSHLRDELYIKKLIDEHNYWHISANKECRRGKFKKATLEEMEKFGTEIKVYCQLFSQNPVSVQRLISMDISGLSDLIEKVLSSSKFSYQDSIVFVSALKTKSHIIVTLDEAFAHSTHLQDLREALKSIPAIKNIEFRKPESFSTENQAKKEYKNWFKKQNKKRQIGKIYHHYPKNNVILVECFKDLKLNVKDFIYLVNFNESTHDMLSNSFKIKQGNIEAIQNKNARNNNKYSIKLPKDFTFDGAGLLWAMVFLYE